jgi:hypothetical protein
VSHLLIAASLVGGILEAFTRVIWERLWLIRWCRPPDILPKLNINNLDLYERGVQSSYKYVTFYANFAWAIALVFAGRLFTGDKIWPVITFVINFTLVIIFMLLLVASHIQWTYFVNYQKKVFDKEDF